MRFQMLCPVIKKFQAVLRAHPDISVLILTEAADYFARTQGRYIGGTIVFKYFGLLRQVIYSTQISGNPEAAFDIL